MITRADRDILYFVKKNNLSNSIVNREPPTHNIYHMQNREYPCLLFGKAVLTVEASFCGILFFLVLFGILMLFRFLSGYENTELLLDQAVSEYECFHTKISTFQGIKKGVFLQWDDKKNICYIKARKRLPVLPGKLFSVRLYQQFCVSDYEGKSMIPETEASEEYVYLAEHGTVYHLRKSCVFLKPEIVEVTYARAMKRRNRSGGKYYPCKSCARQGILMENIVYITPYGDSWHNSLGCPGLKRNIRRVERSKIGKLLLCSKCGQGKG